MTPRTILLVEDNPSDIDLTRRAFEKSNILNPLVIAEDGQEALDYLLGTGIHAERDITQTPALILLDLKLPVLDGLEVLKIIREHDKIRRIPVIILTSSRQEQDVAAGYDLGVNSYIRKPVDFHQFMDAIKTLGLYWLVLNELPPPVS
ncbi:MAG: response regulator [Bacteroidetes bacterium]|nr:MAG: response regulator [Bacteroidota bacterium]